MRIVSYEEYLYRFKDNGYYTEDIIPYLKESKENLKNYILEKDSPIFIFKDFDDVIDVLEALHYDQIFTPSYINQCFEEIEINSTEVYKLLYKYAIAYQCRAECTYFPFRLHIDVNMLKEKIKNAPSEFIVPNYSYKYDMSFLEEPDYEELIDDFKTDKNLTKRREQFINNKIEFICGQFYLEWLGGFGMSIEVLFNQLQIFIEEGLTTNNEINKMLAEFTPTKQNLAIEFYYYYAKEMIYLNLFKWHRYTVDLDINMLTNQIAIFFKSNEKTHFNKEGIVNYFQNHGYILDYYDQSLEDCIKINEYYREKYRALCESEKLK
jgi:hypothetical protein